MEKQENKETNFLEALENNFDWNLIAVLSVWIFLLTTFFMILV